MVWSAGDAVGVGGAGVAPGDVVGEGGVGGAGGVGVAGDCMVDGALRSLWWRGCCCGWFRACALASPGRGLVVCWLTGCGGFGVLRWRRLLVATLMVGCCRRWCA